MAFGDLWLQSVTRPALLAPYISRAPANASTAGPARAQQAGAAALQPPGLVRDTGDGDREAPRGWGVFCSAVEQPQPRAAMPSVWGRPWGLDTHLCEPGHSFAWVCIPASTVFQRLWEAWHGLEEASHPGMAGAGAAESPSSKGHPVPSTAPTSSAHPAKLTGSWMSARGQSLAMTYCGLGGLAARGAVALAWRGGTAQHRALRWLSVEGPVAPGARAGMCSPEQDSHGQGLCGQAGPSWFTPCSSAPA